MTGPRTPVTLLWCNFAIVAADRNPSNEPEMDSFLPFSVAIADPLPATVTSIAVLIGTALSLALNVSDACEETSVINKTAT